MRRDQRRTQTDEDAAGTSRAEAVSGLNGVTKLEVLITLPGNTGKNSAALPAPSTGEPEPDSDDLRKPALAYSWPSLPGATGDKMLPFRRLLGKEQEVPSWLSPIAFDLHPASNAGDCRPYAGFGRTTETVTTRPT
jgi:hypothetical protein